MALHRGLAAALAAALLALGVAAAGVLPDPPRAAADTGPASPCKDPLEDLRCPDLVVTAPYDLTIDRHTRPGHVLLRATSSLNNRGSGPLELRGHRSGARSMKVTQVVYRGNGTRAFIPTAGLLGYKFVSGRRLG